MLTVDYQRLGLRAGERLLDVGCGFGRHTYEAIRLGASVVSCDLGRAELEGVGAMVAAMHERGDIPHGVACIAVRGDATALPFPDASFDRVIASEVLEHIPHDESAFAELTRVLRPGGVLAVTVPARLAEKLCWMISGDYPAPRSPGGHVRIYRRRDVRDRMRACGLRPFAAHQAHALHSPYWWLKCAVGVDNAEHWLVKLYHRLLVWDMFHHPLLTRTLERILDPLIGKSVVFYTTKVETPATRALYPEASATTSLEGSQVANAVC